MKNLVNIVKDRTLKSTNMTNEEIKALIHETSNCLHDPFLYDQMDEFVKLLHNFKLKQDQDSNLLLIVDTDYDTDGIMAATVMSAGLSVLGFNYRVYIPTMSDGYGLSPNAIDKMHNNFEFNNYKIGMILTADNGTNAIKGVKYAQNQGIEVLVTDHHLTTNHNAPASVIINSNKTIKGGEPYPFKENAGAAVIWKCLLAYSQVYAPDKYNLIYDLIVFAGISDVSDVMSITDENHFMVKMAVKEIKRLFDIRQIYHGRSNLYPAIKDTEYSNYNAVFYGLYDLIDVLSQYRDKKRAKEGKKSYPLPNDEELISWYLAPMLNAPRRVHATCRESMLGLISANTEVRRENIYRLCVLNDKKTQMRDKVLNDLDYQLLSTYSGNCLFINAKHGISGLVAGQVAEKTGNPAIVFALPTNLNKNIYSVHEFDKLPNISNNLIIGASARSNENQPINEIMETISDLRPGIIVSGGGHALAGGYSIRYQDLELFSKLFNAVSNSVLKQHISAYEHALKRGEIKPQYQNIVKLSYYDEKDTPDYANYNLNEHEKDFVQELKHVLKLEQALKPFGHNFNAKTQFIFDLEPLKLIQKDYQFNPNFWKTFKFNLYGVDVITFDTELAKLVKDRIEIKNNAIIRTKAEIKVNTFRNRQSIQIQLSM